MFAFKKDALKQFIWMKMLDRTVALYDYEASLLEKHGDEVVILGYDYFVEQQVTIERDWGDEVDLNAPYFVAW